MPNEKLSTQPYKGARDFYPAEMAVQNYIFTTWKKVCGSFGYEEYNFPILEPLEIFAAKTGEEIVNQQLFAFEDRAGRRLAVRPEITPGTVRMLAARYKELNRPVRWFMIGTNWRYEQPQKGRGREFNQLEVNIFGTKNVAADFEIFQIIVSIMKAFGADETMFEVLVSDRRLVQTLLTQTLKLSDGTADKVRQIMDKKAKLSASDFEASLAQCGLTQKQIAQINAFMNSSISTLSDTITKLFELLEQAGLAKYCKFDPSIIRGFDYSDGLVYEVYDKNPSNRRSLFGGERFDKLIQIFGDYDLPATGFAMGDVTLLEFLQGWNLLPALDTTNDYLVALWPQGSSKYTKVTTDIATRLRAQGKKVEVWPEENTELSKQLKYADKKGVKKVIIVGEKELMEGTMTIKDMKSQIQETKSNKDNP